MNDPSDDYANRTKEPRRSPTTDDTSSASSVVGHDPLSIRHHSSRRRDYRLTVELQYPNLHYREPMLLARNTGQGFVDVSADSGSVFHQAWVGRGLATGDIDNDGRVDAVVTTNEG